MSFKKIIAIPMAWLLLQASLSHAATAPQPNPSIKAEVQSSGNQYWTNVSIKLTNTGTSDIDFRGSSIEVNLPTAVTDVYGSYAPLSWPTIKVDSIASGSVYKTNIGLSFGTDNWVQTNLPPNKSITLQFGIPSAANNTAIASSVKVYTNTPIPVTNGSITIQSPQSPGTDAGSAASATLSGPLSNPMQVSLAWSSSKTIASLPLGTYTIHTNQAGSYPSGQDVQITLTSTSPNGTALLSYGPAIKNASLTITTPAQPVANAPAPSAYLSNNGSVQVIALAWGTSKQIPVVDKQTYQLWVPDFTYGDNVYSSNIPETKALNFTATASKATQVNLQFQATAIPTINVNLDIKGLPQASSTVTVSLVSANKTYTFNNLANGSHPVTVQAGTYNLSSSLLTLQGKSYAPALSNPYTLAEGTTVSIGYSEVKTAMLMPFKDVTFNMNWSTTPVSSNLQEIADNSKHYSYVLAFITQNAWDTGHCYPAWGGQPTLALKDKYYQKEVQYLQSKNGAVALSFGGENGLSIESKCTQAELVQVYQSAFDIYNLAFIDFDIEGGALGDTAANTNRFKALKDLQTQNSKAKVSLTLPANIDGFPPQALALIQQAKDLGVNISEYNMMTMAWYAQKLTGPISDSVSASAQKGFQQLQAIFPEKSPIEIWSMIRVTPKIGVDYDQSILYPEDALHIGQFVKQKGMAGIGFWSADIDRNQNKTGNCNQGANPDCSGITQAPYDFTKSFLSGLGQ
ncbi:hypothetical protein [Legionella sp. km772]|uniref:hypothetical protein n=1 Tax=Legionella sp. km772 TaxID=2498111 RepID=UPI000F8EEE45|nr:hypothetical protein [Legionella sp. km772]RUR08442.1 hypothetical protein ELY15_10860 [Legionella sp. km772]